MRARASQTVDLSRVEIAIQDAWTRYRALRDEGRRLRYLSNRARAGDAGALGELRALGLVAPEPAAPPAETPGAAAPPE